MDTRVSYGRSGDAWHGFAPFLMDIIANNPIRKVCDIGGGANPVLGQDYIEQVGLEYTLMDLSATELAKAPSSYRKMVVDVESPDLEVDEEFDLIFSQMLMEHIRDAEQCHRNILKCLAHGGLAVHYFPTLYALPFVVNRVIPNRLGGRMLDWFSPRDKFQRGKFPAYYRWCRGPTRRQIGRFTSLGYSVVEYRGFFGHRDYYTKIAPVLRLHEARTAYLLAHPSPSRTSFAYVVLKKE